MRSPVVTIVEGMKEKKWIKKKIEVGPVVKAQVGNMGDNTREGISRTERKDTVGFLQTVVWKKKFLIQFEDGQKKEMSSCSIFFKCSKEEVEMDKLL